MAFIWEDRILETTTTTGTGNLTTAGAVAGNRAFSAVCSTNDTFHYYCEAVDSNGVPTGDFETGLGTYSGSNTIARTAVIRSSNSNAAVNFSAGTKRIGIAPLGQDFFNVGCPPLSTFTWGNQGTSTATQTVTGGAISLAPQNNSGTLNWRILSVNQPSTPYRVRAQMVSFWGGGNSQTAGIYFYDGTKIDGIETLSQAAGYVINTRRSSALSAGTSSNATYGGQWTGNTAGTSPIWFQIRNDATNLYFDFSFDGQNFTNVLTEAVGTYLTPTKVAFGALNVTSTGSTLMDMNLLNWQTQASASLN